MSYQEGTNQYSGERNRVLTSIQHNPGLRSYNSHITRHRGSQMSFEELQQKTREAGRRQDERFLQALQQPLENIAD